ncbi:MAG: hypothetical protein ABFS41_17965 [Myxococcota bacterium]
MPDEAKDRAPGERPRHARRALWLFVGLLVVYSANGRDIGASDTVANQLLPVAVLRGDGLVLNRFAATQRGHYYVKEHGDDLISRYPVLPAVMAVPATGLQMVVLDRLVPGWSRSPIGEYWYIAMMSKNASALLAALTGVLLYLLLLRVGLADVALGATFATALGSNLWVVGSQAPWLHGTVAFFLVLSLLVLVPAPTVRWRLVVGGLAMAGAVCARPTSAVFALPLAVWALAALRARGLWLVAPAGAVGLLLVGCNWAVFGNLTGGLGEIEALGHAKHAVEGSITQEPLVSFAGTLVSPARGLFVYTPWVLLALLLLPHTWRRTAAFGPLRAVLLGLLPFYAVVGTYSVWWGGWSFGPRYWTEAMPLLGVLLGFALAWAREHSRAWRAGLGAAVGVAIAIQGIGAFCYPSSWNESPGHIDRHHERLWDWRDTELHRSLLEGPHRPAAYEWIRRALTG